MAADLSVNLSSYVLFVTLSPSSTSRSLWGALQRSLYRLALFFPSFKASIQMRYIPVSHLL
jgi:hypothetical protein